ncbi:MAG: hypothetical protein JXQ69_03775 [Paludibacteraceae bacterium]|nr:hypothetical protein [Paludibacteraceae bacterium]
MKFGDFLNTLAKKVGKENDPALVAILSNSELANRDINDDFANTLDTNLMSLDGAKNNPALLNHFKPVILAGIDNSFAALGNKFELGDDFLTEKSTYKKAEILESKIAAKLAAIEESKSKGDPAKEAKLQEQLVDLQSKLGQLTDQKTAELNQLKSQHEIQMNDMLVKFNLTGKKYANKDLPMETQTIIAKTLLDAKIKESGAILINDGGVLKLKQAANPTMDYVDAGFKPVSFNDFADKVLADNKLLEVSGGTPPPTQAPAAPRSISAPGQQINSSSFDAALQASQSDVK